MRNFESTEIINNQWEFIGTYGCGAITDGTYKLQIQVVNFANDINYKPGQKVVIIINITKKFCLLNIQFNLFNNYK